MQALSLKEYLWGSFAVILSQEENYTVGVCFYHLRQMIHCRVELFRKINEKWGVHINSKDNDRNPSSTCKSISHRNKSGSTGAETIGIPVCKKKYAPFEFRKKVLDDDGRVYIEVVRMYGCHCHSTLREKVIRRYGVRRGWEPFGQWSMKKAQQIAKKLMEKINSSIDDSCDDSSSSSSLSDVDDNPVLWKKMCNNGKCAWKMKHKYDDIVEELHERNANVEHN